MKIAEDIEAIMMEVEGGDSTIWHRTSNHRITCSVQVYEGGQMANSYTLREFLDALNITAEDCQKAFEDSNVESTDGECFYCSDKLRDDEVKAYHDKRTCDACYCLLVDYAKSTETEANNAD